MRCEMFDNQKNKKKNIIESVIFYVGCVLLFIFLIAVCIFFRKVEDRHFEQSSMFSVVEDNSYWTVYYHKETKVMWIRNKGGRSADFEVLVDENGNPMISED